MRPIINYCRGQYESHVTRDAAKANMYFTLAIIQNSWNSALLPKISALIGLSDNCLGTEEYLLSKKALEAAYKLCDGYCMKSFVENTYHRCDNVLDVLIEELKCGYCGRCWNEGRFIVVNHVRKEIGRIIEEIAVCVGNIYILH